MHKDGRIVRSERDSRQIMEGTWQIAKSNHHKRVRLNVKTSSKLSLTNQKITRSGRGARDGAVNNSADFLGFVVLAVDHLDAVCVHVVRQKVIQVFFCTLTREDESVIWRGNQGALKWLFFVLMTYIYLKSSSKESPRKRNLCTISLNQLPNGRRHELRDDS